MRIQSLSIARLSTPFLWPRERSAEPFVVSCRKLQAGRCISRALVVLTLLSCLAIGVWGQSIPPNNVTYFTNPQPTESSAESPEGHEVVLRKELSGYPNYGVADGRSDIL